MDFFHTLLSIVFPPSKEEVLVASMSHESLVTRMNVRPIEHGTALFRYDDEIIRAIVWEVKYKKNPHAITLMADTLKKYIEERHDEAPLLIPIPLSPKRMKERGFNQVEEILREVCTDPLFQFNSTILTRVRETIPQTQLSRKQRLTNLSGAFGVPESMRGRIKDAHLILVDDVATTGTTLAEARRTLLRAGAHRVDTLAFAH